MTKNQRKPMTVGELREALGQQPGQALVAWVNDGSVGYFYADEQEMAVDDGHVHLACGPAFEESPTP